MTNSDDHFAEFEAHTRLKHLILETYIKAWARKLLLRNGAGSEVLFIDACAGTGRDDAGNSGSPVIAAREAAMAASQVSKMRGVPVRVMTAAIEKDPKRFRELQAVLRPFGANARALEGELLDHLPKLLADAGPAPILCFIDPFGLQPLRAEIVKTILNRPQCEVFVLFHDQACLRHFGAAASAATASLPPIPDLFSAFQAPPRTPSPEERRSTTARAITAERAVVILDDAFGDSDWRARVTAVRQSGRRAEFLRLYEQFLKDAGAAFVLSIPIRNDANQHVYHLVHASRSVYGYVAMKEAVSSALKKTDLAAHAALTMKFAISSNLQTVARDIIIGFAGRTVPWTTVGEEGVGPLLEHVLHNTPVFPHEMKGLQELLKPYKRPGQKVIYTFPGSLQPVVPSKMT